MAHPHQNDNAVASSSSARSTSTSYGPYDVFINHRGPDTKKTFAARLYDRLKSHRLQVFLDERELEPGHEFPAQIKAAIEGASVHVAVFSATYQKSEWCLKELLLMEKSRGIILPVYYKVEPSDLRHGAYLDYLRQKKRYDDPTLQKKRYDDQTLQNWENALKRSADLTGFPLSAYNGDEVELLEKLAQCVEEKVRKTQFNVSKHPTGLAAKFKDFERKLLSRQKEAREARVVGIWGGGGIGKTTLAKEIFNRTRFEYSGASFLFHVREKASINSLNILQSDLINHLRHQVVKIDSRDQGIEILQDYLTNYHALIILDDVDNADQLHAFLPIKRVLDPRSLILVTSRDKQALVSANIADTSIYQLTGLDAPDSKKLFCLHAFSQPDPKPGFETLVDGFLTVCKGLPLSLKVVGGLLCEQNILYWEAQLKGLHHLPGEIDKCLQISYESLIDIERQIFLDIACFSIGKDKDTWIRIWAESGWNGVTGFQNLINKCLVEVDGENKIRMHDHVRDMGRSISSQSRPRTRLWNATMTDVHLLLEQSSEVHGIRMAPGSSSRDTSEMPFNKTSSQYMCSELRLFEAEGDFVNTILTRVKLPNLIWLSWTECPCSSLPSCIPTESLKVLEVTGRKLGKLWQSDHKVPLLLQELNINAPLLEFPKSLRQLVQLEKIVVECSMDEDAHLATLPEDLPDLCFLKYLMLKRCSKLQTIPDSIGRLRNLRQINLSGCKNLERLPKSLGCLTNIQTLDLSACESLTELPESLGNLSNLQDINLSKCKYLGMLPISVGHFVKLQRIELSGCTSLERLPVSFVDLATLQYVDLSQCEFLESLPDSFGNLINIQHIDMSGCKSLQELPNSWVNLTGLQHIDLSGCRRLERLPDTLGNLTNLHYINLCECENLKKLPEFNPNFTNIQDLNLYGCKSLKMLPESIKNLTNLRHIDLSECTSLGSLPESFVKLTNLQHIDFQGGKCLEVIPRSFGMLTELQHIDFRRCSSLKKLPDSFGDLKSLQHLDLQGCSSLEKLPDSFGRLTNLKHINLSSCKSLKTLPNSFGDLLQLKHLDLTDCCTLTISSEPLETAAQLYLRINIKQLPEDVVCLSKLELLHLEAPLLESLPPRLDQLRSLKKLYLVECRKLQYLPNSVGLLIQLNELEIRDCAIENLPQALLELNNLEHLEVCKCPLGQLPFKNVGGESETELLTEGQRASSGKGMLNLKVLHLEALEISEISFPPGVCPKLNHLRIRDCMQIAEVGALPTTLRTLDLRRCGALRNIGGLCFVATLQNLDMRGCYKVLLDARRVGDIFEGI